MNNTFRQFLDNFLNAWKNSSLSDLKDLISKDYHAREISGGEILDFGYDESIIGWEQGFNFAKENKAQWVINELAVLTLNDAEIMVILSATMIIEGKKFNSGNLFFETFKKSSINEWKLVRSYIEAGVPLDYLNKLFK